MEFVIDQLLEKEIYGFTFEGITIDEDNKKKLHRIPSWSEINKNNFRSYIYTHHKAFAVLTGKISNITVLDFDVKNNYCSYEQVIKDYPQLKNYKTVRTWSGGYHIYCLYDEEINTTTNAFTKYENVDIRNDKAIIISYPILKIKKLLESMKI